MPGPDVLFWQQRFASGNTPWDRGAPSPQLARWIDEGVFPPGAHVVVPGSGAGHELPVLAAHGCRVTGVDYADAAVARSRAALAAAAQPGNVVQADVLVWQPDAPVDAVYEQTCLCALHPDHWVAYAAQLARWLVARGRLAALFMQSRNDGAARGFISGPPYHCDIHAMRALFGADRWHWAPPPYEQLDHPAGTELAVVLTRR
jgi:hypothetical protein